MQEIHRENLPQEVWFTVLSFVADEDLHTLSQVHPFFHDMCNDAVLWRQIKSEVFIPRLDHKLYRSPSRLTRDELVERCILKTVGSPALLSRQIRQGSYINGPNGVILYETQQGLERTFKSRFLREKLMNRHSFQDLVESGFLPQGNDHPNYYVLQCI